MLGGSVPSSKGSSSTGSDEPVTVTFAQKSDPTTLDAHRSYGDVGSNVLTNITEPLVAFDGDDKLYGVLAESWEATGECESTFHLRQGVTFSNGEPFNAEAVVWNINRAMSTEYPRDSYEFTPFVEKVEAVDEYTVKFTTNKPDWTLPNQLVLVTFIAPAYSEKIGEEAISQDPVGTGPYTLTEWKRDQQIVLTARKDYWGGEPEVDQYIIKVIPETTTQIAELQTGNVDILTLKQLLGHSSVGTTQIYTHLQEFQVRSAIEENPLGKVLPINAAKASLDTTDAAGETSVENDPAGEDASEPSGPMAAFEGAAQDGFRADISAMSNEETNDS